MPDNSACNPACRLSNSSIYPGRGYKHHLCNRGSTFRNNQATNLTVDFVIYVYDCCKRLLATLPVTGVVYLPSATTDPEYDEDTNPTSVTMQLFAPYGVTYTDTTAATPNLNFIGFLSTNGTVSQGLNLMAMSKVLNFDIANAEMTVGLTLIVKSIYYNQYRIPHNGQVRRSLSA